MSSNIKYTLHTTILGVLLLVFSNHALAKSVVNIQHWQTANGAHVYFVASNDLPMVDIKVAFHAGSAYDSQHYGLAAMTNSLLSEGTHTLSADEIATQFDNVGAQFANDVSRDGASLSLRSLVNPKRLNPALQTLAQIISAPSFPEKSFKRVQNQTLLAIQSQQQNLSTMTNNAFYKALYGSEPYGHPVIGVKNTVSKLTRQDLIDFYKQYYVAKNAVVVIVGDVNKKSAESIANELVAKLPQGHAATAIPNMAPSQQGIVKSISYPATQTHIRLGQVGIKMGNPDYFPLLVGNHILGGGVLTSRLFIKVREQQGLSYSIYSYFLPLESQGPFAVGLQTKNADANKALTLTKQVLDNFIRKGPTSAELNAAKKNIIGGFPISLDSNRDIANTVMEIGFYQLPLNYLDTYRDKVAAVTDKQIKQAFTKYLNPKDMVVVMVGKPNAKSAKG